MTPSMELSLAKVAVKEGDVRPEIIRLANDWIGGVDSDELVAALLERVCALSVCLSDMLEDGDETDRAAAKMALGWPLTDA